MLSKVMSSNSNNQVVKRPVRANAGGIDGLIDLDALNSALNIIAPLTRAAQAYAKIQEKEQREESKTDINKVEDFKAYVYPIYAAHAGTKPEMINRIFDEHQIDSKEKGFLMREMAIAIKHTIPEYRDKTITEMMDIVSQWINEANKLRIATKTGSKIHPTEHGGHYKFRWHIMYFEGDYEKQREYLTVRVQSADKTLQNRIDEWINLQQKKEELEQQQQIVVSTDGQHQQEEAN